MKVSKYILATLTASFIFAGCSEANEVQDNINETSGDITRTDTVDENAGQSAKEKLANMETTDDETLNAVIERSKDIDSYEALIDLEGKINNAQPDILQADVRFKEGESGGPPSLHLKSEGEDRTFSKDGETFYHNGTDWVDISDSVGVEQLYQVTYHNAVLTFADIKDKLEKEDNGDTVVYSYDGESTEVFETFKQLFADNFGNIDISTIENHLEIEVDADENLIKDIDYQARGENEDKKIELAGDVEFKSFNSIGEIEIPAGARQ